MSVVPVFLADALGEGAGWRRLRPRPALIATGALASFAQVPDTLRKDARWRQFVADLEREGVRFCYTDFFMATRLNFLSGERVVCSAKLGPNTTEYFFEYRERVEQAPEAAIVAVNPTSAGRLEEKLAGLGVRYERLDLMKPVLLRFSRKVDPQDLFPGPRVPDAVGPIRHGDLRTRHLRFDDRRRSGPSRPRSPARHGSTNSCGGGVHPGAERSMDNGPALLIRFRAGDRRWLPKRRNPRTLTSTRRRSSRSRSARGRCGSCSIAGGCAGSASASGRSCVASTWPSARRAGPPCPPSSRTWRSRRSPRPSASASWPATAAGASASTGWGASRAAPTAASPARWTAPRGRPSGATASASACSTRPRPAPAAPASSRPWTATGPPRPSPASSRRTSRSATSARSCTR